MRFPAAVLIMLTLLLSSMDLPAADSPVEQEWKTFEKLVKSLTKESQQKEIDQELKLAAKSIEKARKTAKKAGPSAAVSDLKTAQRFLRNINIRSGIETESFQHSARDVLRKMNAILESLGVYRHSMFSRNGLRTVQLEFPEAIMQLNWPESAVTGEAISGTFRLRLRYPESPSALETVRQEYRLQIQGRSVDWAETYTLWKLPRSPESVNVRLTDYFGNVLTEATLRSSPAVDLTEESGKPQKTDPPESAELIEEPPPNEPVANVEVPHMLFRLPPVGQVGNVMHILGDFDGDASTTVVRLDGKPVWVLAESTNETLISLPDVISSAAELYIREAELRTRCKLFPLHVQISPSTGTLEAGQHLPVVIQVNGITRLRKPVVLRLEGIPADSFSIDGGSTDWSIENGTADSLNYMRTLAAAQTTPFRLEAWIDTQQATEMCIPPAE